MARSDVRRMNELLGDPPPQSISISRCVFGVGGPGEQPIWVQDPAWEIQAEFWRTYGDSVAPESQVHVALGNMAADEVCDAHGNPVDLGIGSGPGHLFFEDPKPLANWAHSCRYYFRTVSGVWGSAAHRWPPDERIELRAIQRLAVVP